MTVRPNKRINVKTRTQTSTFEGTPVLTMRHSDVRAFVKLARGTLATAEGEQVTTDGIIRVHPRIELVEGDVIEILPKVAVRYRVESVDEILSGAGVLTALRGTMVRDASLE